MTRKELLLFVFLLLTGLLAQAQSFSIGGSVSDQSDVALPAATIFISNSSYKAISNDKGEFRLSNIQPGNYELVVTMVGFHPHRQNLSIQQESIQLAIRLKQKANILNEVIITSNSKRKEYLKIFIKNFIGETENAKDCVIENPEVLSFYYDDEEKQLEASADEMLIITNKSLGYRLIYLLKSFKFNTREGALTYEGSPYFEELEGNSNQQKRWNKKRLIAYNGSAMHFLRSLFRNTLNKDGFIFYENKADSSASKAIWQQSEPHFRIEGTDFMKFGLKDSLYILYTQEAEPYDFYTTGSRVNVRRPALVLGKEQVSLIKPLSDSVLVYKNGTYTGLKFLFLGYVGWERIADMVPVDYEPDSHALPPIADSPPDFTLSFNDISEISDAMDTCRAKLPQEKLYLHLDKPNYITGDTLWFKAYLLQGAELTASKHSNMFYIELANDSNVVMKRMKFPLKDGLGWGQIPLSAEDYPEGGYTLRAYTNLMRNFGEEAIFTKRIYLASPMADSWLASLKLTPGEQKNVQRVNLQFNKLDKLPLGFREMEIRVLDGKRSLYRNNVTSTAQGLIDFNLTLPEKTNIHNITLIAEDKRKGEGNRILRIPLSINRPENTDLQFMPEGGNLVAGINSRVGFKAIGEDGKGVEAAGRILNSKQQEVARFKSLHKGMGSFEFKPEANEMYTAELSLANGTTKAYPLPQVQTTGTVININNHSDSDSLTVQLSATADLTTIATTYYLIGQTRGKVYYSKEITLNVAPQSYTIPKSIFPGGITRFTLLNKEHQPLNERMVYTQPKEKLNIQITPDAKTYKSRDSIALNISVTDQDGYPVEGSFSLSVTDDNQVKPDSITNSNIFTHMLLASGLKGTIEEPNYYTGEEYGEQQALDNLLLAQGWTGYDWNDVFTPKLKQYPAEQEVVISGRITNLVDKAVAGTNVFLYSQNPFVAKDTLTDENGRFRFTNLPISDSVSYRIEGRNLQGKSMMIGAEIDEFTPQKFSATTHRMPPWFLNSDNTLLQSMQSTISNETLSGKNVLKEVIINARRNVQVFDEEDLNTVENMTLYDYLFKNVEGFRIERVDLGHYDFVIKTKKTTFPNRGTLSAGIFIDGDQLPYSLGPRMLGTNLYGLVIKKSGWLKSFTMDDLREIKVQGTSIFVSTKGGKGLTLEKPGIVVYRPKPQFTLPQQFYRPKYAVKDTTATAPDLRSTLHWEPNVVTDAEGKAIVSFYSADKPSSYTVIVEGSDMDGKIGWEIEEALIRIIP